MDATQAPHAPPDRSVGSESQDRLLHPPSPNLKETTMSDDSRPYSKDAQIFTFGVHGTNNDPSNVREVAGRISVAVGETTDGANLFDNGFSWQNRSGTTNGTREREASSTDLSGHVLRQVDRALEAGTLDRDKPLTINLVGFSHGGNVALLASDNIAAGLRERGLESAIHVTTLSTPAYTRGAESPDTAAAGVQSQGVNFNHTHFSVAGDGVIRAAIGNSNYDNEPTRNFNMNSVSTLNGVANHGAPQDSDAHMNAISGIMRQRFNGLAPPQIIAGKDDNETQIAGVTPATPTATNGASQWDAINNNPTAQQVSSALHRAVPEVPQENQNPSLIAGLTEAAATNRMSAVRDVGFSPDQQTAFLADRDKSDPAAKIVPVNMDVANKPFDQAWQKAAVALETTQSNPAVALNPEQDLAQKQSPRSMA
jgi:hypothetical protein